MNPIEAHNQEADQYDAQAKAWGWTPDVFFGLMWEYVRGGDRLLDAGIGTGLCSRPFHKAGVRVFGMDASEEMLRLCRKHHPGFDLERHDVNTHPWPYADNAFNFVIAGGVLHFFGRLEPLFQEVERVLRPGGVFGFNTAVLGEGEVEQAGVAADKSFARVLDTASGVHIYKHGKTYIQGLLARLGMSVEKKLTFLASRNPQTGAEHYSTLFVARYSV